MKFSKRIGGQEIMQIAIAGIILGLIILVVLFTTHVGFVQKGGANLVTSISDSFSGVIK